MKLKKKYKNLIALIIFVPSLLLVLHDFIIVCTTLAGFTAFGVITFIGSLTLAYYTGDYLYEQLK